MALLWIEGFEGFGTTDNANPAPSGVMARKYASVVGESAMYLMAGRITGHSLEIRAYGDYFQTPTLTTDATLVVGFALYYSLAYTDYIIRLFDGATLGVNLRLESGGELGIYRGSTQLGVTSGLGLTAGNWYWIELKVVCNDSGSYALHVGEVNVLSGSADTKAGSHDYHDQVSFGYGCGTTTKPRFDDIYILDGSGSVNNDFLGNHKVTAIFPNGDVGGYTDFTCSAGTDHYALVDENPITDDTDYVESSTTGHTDLWDYGAVGGIGVIAGIQINTQARETDANPFTLKTVIKSDVTVDADAGQAIGTTNYKSFRRISEADPHTTSAWTTSGVDAAEFGVKVG